jgi:multidrug resistance protein
MDPPVFYASRNCIIFCAEVSLGLAVGDAQVTKIDILSYGGIYMRTTNSKSDDNANGACHLLSHDYENWVIFRAALLNGIAGIVVDLYAPSLPQIAYDFNTTVMAAQATISTTVIGYALGQLFFGILCDWRGRKASIIIGLIIFALSSILAGFSPSIQVLLMARVIQGFAAGACQVVARAILVDVVPECRFNLAVTYLSVAFAMGLIAGPYCGALIQQWLGWRWNFAVYAIYSAALLCSLWHGMKESLPRSFRKSPGATLHSYIEVLSNWQFIVLFIQLGCCFLSFTLWNQIGPFVIQRNFSKDSTYFGITALLAGVAYLMGSLINRLLITRVSTSRRIGLSVLSSSCGIILIGSGGNGLFIETIVIGLVLIALGQGLAFPNVLARAMSMFPDKAGVAASIQGGGMLLMGAAGLWLLSYRQVQSNIYISIIYGVFLLIFLIAGNIGSFKRQIPPHHDQKT